MVKCQACDNKPKGIILRVELPDGKAWICPDCAAEFGFKEEDPAVTYYFLDDANGKPVLTKYKPSNDADKVKISRLPIGSTVRICDGNVTCTILYKNDCRVLVRATTGMNKFKISDDNDDEKTVEFKRRSDWNISTSTLCVPVKENQNE
jgi:hypothetical protein